MSDRIWIRSTVEEMRAAEDYTWVARAKWDAMSEKERDDFLVDCATELMNNQGGCGASVVDEDDVPEDEKGRPE